MKWSSGEMNAVKKKKEFYHGTSRLSDDYHRILTNFLHKNALNWLFLCAAKTQLEWEREMEVPRWEVDALLSFN